MIIPIESKIQVNSNEFNSYLVRCQERASKTNDLDPSMNDLPSNPLMIRPWYTIPAIHALDDLNLCEFNCIEHGSGISTLYYLQRVAQLISFENDLATFGALVINKIRSYGLNVNNFYYLKDYNQPSSALLHKYLRFFSQDLPLLVAIDGGNRDALIESWLDILLFSSAQIVLLIDNSDSPNYRKYFASFFNNNAYVANYYGPSLSSNSYYYATTIVTKRSALLANTMYSPYGHSQEIVTLDHQRNIMKHT